MTVHRKRRTDEELIAELDRHVATPWLLSDAHDRLVELLAERVRPELRVGCDGTVEAL